MGFCTECGVAVTERHKYCGHCGAATSQPPSDHVPGVRDGRPRVTEPERVPIPERAQFLDRGQDLSFPRSGSTLLADQPDTPAAEPSTFRGLPPSALAAGAFVLIMLSALGGYRWFRGARPVVPPVAVEATEGSLDAPGPTKAAGPAASVAPVEGTWSLITEDTREATDGIQALGLPDEKLATIAPGGRLALTLRAGEFFYNGEGPDVQVYGMRGEPARYTVFARAEAASPWQRFDVNRTGFPIGEAAHDMGHHGMNQARQIMIKNDGRTALAIDAVMTLHKQPEAHDDDHAEAAKPPIRK